MSEGHPEQASARRGARGGGGFQAMQGGATYSHMEVALAPQDCNSFAADGYFAQHLAPDCIQVW